MPEDPQIHHVTRDLDDTKSRLGKVESSVAVLTDKVGNLSETFEGGMRDIKTLIRDSNNRPTSFSPATIYSFIGLLAIGVTAFWGAIQLLYTPLKEQSKNKSDRIDKLIEASFNVSNGLSLVIERSEENKRDIAAGLARVDSESASRHAEQQRVIERMEDNIAKLNEQRVLDAERHGRLAVMDEWLRDDTEAVKEDVIRHEDKYHP